VAALTFLGALDEVELQNYDRLVELRGPRQPRAPIVIVAIDESSIIELDHWPFARATHAQLIDRVSAGAPLAIGIHLLFDGPSIRGLADDAALGAAVARAGNVVLAQAPRQSRGVIRRFDFNPPVPLIGAGAAAVGHVGNAGDPDGRVRRVLLVPPQAYGGLPAFGASIVRVASGSGLPAAPLPSVPSPLINFRGPPRTFPWISYYQVIRGEIGPEHFRGKIVLIGATSDTLHDLAPTPFARDGSMPGVEIHANVIETLLRGNRIREMPPIASASAALLAGTAIGVLMVMRARQVVAIALIAWVAMAVGSWLVMVVFDAWLRPIAPSAALVLSLLACVITAQTWRATPDR
jgi:adenylate cyclase